MTTRKDVRHEVADLITATLGATVSAVYSGQVGDFQKARSVVVVSSGGSAPNPLAVRRHVGRHQVNIDVFVLYADPEAGWDEEDAEDLLDDISAGVIAMLEAHPTGKNWQALEWEAPSQTAPVAIGGVEYRRETITLTAS